jgi:hypothetical protein
VRSESGYKIGLKLADDVFFVLDINAENFSEAVQKWAFVSGHNDPLFNKENNTYFGWPVVEIITTKTKKKRSQKVDKSKTNDTIPL